MSHSQTLFFSMIILIVMTCVLLARGRGIDFIVGFSLIPLIMARFGEWSFLMGRSSVSAAKYTLFSLWLIPPFLVLGTYLNMTEVSKNTHMSPNNMKYFVFLLLGFSLMSVLIAVFWVKSNSGIRLDFSQVEYLKWSRTKERSGRSYSFMGESNALFSIMIIVLGVAILYLNLDPKTFLVLGYAGVSWLYITMNNDPEYCWPMFITYSSGAAFLTYLLWLQK